ncbi:MAG: response regulator [Alphaproteobacteria bacterium]
MDDFNLSHTNLVLLAGQRELRNLIKSALHGIGFGFIRECRTVSQARLAIANAEPDLLIVDLDLDDGGVCKLINDVRYERLGGNPFLVIIGLTGRPEAVTVHSALEAGTDDVVRKPVSTQLLSGRIINLIRNRKQFVATSDYVGPKRGEGVLPVSDDIVPLEVPNSLRDKATNRRIAPVDEEAIRRAAMSIGLERLHRIALDVVRLGGELEALLAGGHDGFAIADVTARLSEMVSRVVGIDIPEDENRLPHLVASMRQAMETLSREARPSPRRVEVLRLHAQAIAATARGDEDDSGAVTAALGKATVLGG